MWKKFIYEFSVINHIKSTFHYKDFTCDICDKYFSSEEGLEKHKQSKNHNDNYVCDSLTCEFCNKSFLSEQAKENHQKSKKHSEDYFCSVCKKLFSTVKGKEAHCRDKCHY